MDALELQSLLSSLFDFVEATIRHVVDKVDVLEQADTNSCNLKSVCGSYL